MASQHIRVFFFATLRDIVGARQLQLSLGENSASIGQLRARLAACYPAAEQHLQVALAAINEEFAFDEDLLQAGDEVAFFPPVSGGSAHPELIALPREPIAHDAIVRAISSERTGAVCMFSGIVRGRSDKAGHLPQTQSLQYEAYEGMALAKMRQVAAEIRQRWPRVEGIAILQRLGQLQVGDNTVLCACSSPHRDDGCFEAARYGIDRLKEIVPVWKKELGRDGETWIEGDYRPQATDKSAVRKPEAT